VTRALEVAIVGYGIAGIAAAIHLRRQGHIITHFDRNDPPVALGAGMLLHPPALRQLGELGVAASALLCGAPVRRICAQTVRGRPIMDFGYSDLAPGQFGLGIQRSTLHRLLSRADPGRDQIRGGCKITSLDPYLGYLFEECGARYGPYDLIVVADGANSLLRRLLPISVHHNRLAESAALVGLLNDPNGLGADRLVQYFDGVRHLSMWPVGRESTNREPRCSIAMNIALSEAAAFRDRGAWRDIVGCLCPGIFNLVSDCVDNSSLHIFSYRDVELSHCAVGRVALIGDAAHSMSPQLGNGAQLAMEDAAMLATFVGRHDDLLSALHAFGLARPLQLRSYHRASRWLTPLFQSDSRILAVLRDNLFASMMHFSSVKRIAHSLLS
jgi:2-polyprenyl-6-methoxyphenol hydroxylase-like FAD-dependent oxidoreductase